MNPAAKLTGMSIYSANENSLRPQGNRLLLALVISLSAHLLLYGGFECGRKLGWWEKDLMPSWLKTIKKTVLEIQKLQRTPPPVQQEIQLTFVEVDPNAATQEAPKNATHYSSKNSLAANPDPTIETLQPKIDGTQKHVAKTEDVPRTKQFPLRPSVANNVKPASDKKAEDQPRPKAGPKPGDLAMAKPAPKPDDGKAQTENGDAPVIEPHKRWRTLAEAEMHQNPLAGQKMKQDGGVRRNRVMPSFDTKATAFGAYDAQIIAAIQQRWYDLLDNSNVTATHTGVVRVAFRLNYDGRVTDMRVIESTVDEMFSYMCQRAITEPAPYERWPSDMRRIIGADYRDVQFSFFYE